MTREDDFKCSSEYPFEEDEGTLTSDAEGDSPTVSTCNFSAYDDSSGAGAVLSIEFDVLESCRVSSSIFAVDKATE